MPGTTMPQTSKYDVFMDGSCSFCQWMQARIEPYDSDARLQFLDYNDPEIASQAPFPPAALDSEMHVRTPGGKWVRGYQAWLALLRVLPRLRWLGWIGSLPPISWMGPSAYRFVARHRYSFPGAPPRCENDTCAPASRPK